jgi:hypothetical protein
MNNPLDDLASFDSASLPHAHSSGRRELRSSILARGINIIARARTEVERLKAAVKGEMISTLPVKRKSPKRPAGMSARQWKKQKKAAHRAAKATVESAHPTE